MAAALFAFLGLEQYDDGLLSVRGDALAERTQPVVERWAEDLYVIRLARARSGASLTRLIYAEHYLRAYRFRTIVAASSGGVLEAVRLVEEHPVRRNRRIYGAMGAEIGCITRRHLWRPLLILHQGLFLDCVFEVDFVDGGYCRACVEPYMDGWRVAGGVRNPWQERIT